MGESVSMRTTYGEALVALGRARPDVVVLSADVSNSDHSYYFQEAFPDRFVNVGIAEQSLVDVAVGFAYTGYVPLANTFSFLFATRALEMIRTHVCYGRANVKLMGAYGGLSDSYDGPTHHSITDIAILRSLPHMTVVVPAGPVALATLLPQIAAWDGPVFCRLNRNEVPTIYDRGTSVTIGRAQRLRDGTDITLVACGLMVSRALVAADELARRGVEARVLDMHTVKPLDEGELRSAAEETGALVTAEEHSVVGGLGGAVAEYLSGVNPVPIRRVGLQDRFAETGPYDAILQEYGMAADHIVTAALSVIKQKPRA
jgi:transketolase